MVETFTSRIKVSNFAEMFVFTNSLIGNLAPPENKPITYDAMKMGRIHREF